MEDFKRRNFEKAYPGVKFPAVHTLTSRETMLLRARIAERLGCSPDDGLQLVRCVASRAVHIASVNAESNDFQLIRVLKDLAIEPQTQVYINWYRFDRLDRIDVEDLAHCFDDIWYPSSDDIEIFDETLGWVLSVGHSGDVSVARLTNREVNHL